MYEAHWGLNEKPFENTPNPKYIYYSKIHKEAIYRLLYAIREKKGAAILTGEYGSGKTLVAKVLWQELSQEHIYNSVFIFNPRLSTDEFLDEIFFQLKGISPPTNKAHIFREIQKILYDIHTAKRHTVIVIDEAQAILNDDIFEELRLLLNFQLEDSFLITLILLGQPELKQKILNLPQLNQRISIKYHLSALNEADTRSYILHRLNIAGAKKDIFQEDVYSLIYSASGGIPRKINNICDLALLIGYTEEANLINRAIISEAIKEIEQNQDAFGRRI